MENHRNMVVFHGISMGFYGISMGFLWDLPRDLASGLICYIAIEHGHRNNEFAH